MYWPGLTIPFDLLVSYGFLSTFLVLVLLILRGIQFFMVEKQHLNPSNKSCCRMIILILTKIGKYLFYPMLFGTLNYDILFQVRRQLIRNRREYILMNRFLKEWTVSPKQLQCVFNTIMVNSIDDGNHACDNKNTAMNLNNYNYNCDYNHSPIAMNDHDHDHAFCDNDIDRDYNQPDSIHDMQHQSQLKLLAIQMSKFILNVQLLHWQIHHPGARTKSNIINALSTKENIHRMFDLNFANIDEIDFLKHVIINDHQDNGLNEDIIDVLELEKELGLEINSENLNNKEDKSNNESGTSLNTNETDTIVNGVKLQSDLDNLHLYSAYQCYKYRKIDIYCNFIVFLSHLLHCSLIFWTNGSIWIQKLLMFIVFVLVMIVLFIFYYIRDYKRGWDHIYYIYNNIHPTILKYLLSLQAIKDKMPKVLHSKHYPATYKGKKWIGASILNKRVLDCVDTYLFFKRENGIVAYDNMIKWSESIYNDKIGLHKEIFVLIHQFMYEHEVDYFSTCLVLANR